VGVGLLLLVGMFEFGLVTMGEYCAALTETDLRRWIRLMQLETVASVTEKAVDEEMLWRWCKVRIGLICHGAVMKPD
jgi:hypothetical protein